MGICRSFKIPAIYERVTDRRQYPWNGHIVRNKEEKYKGQMMANFKRGRGDNMGTAVP